MLRFVVIRSYTSGGNINCFFGGIFDNSNRKILKCAHVWLSNSSSMYLLHGKDMRKVSF